MKIARYIWQILLHLLKFLLFAFIVSFMIYFISDFVALQLKTKTIEELDVYTNVSMAFLTIAILFFTFISHSGNLKLQRQTHKDNVKLVYREKYLEIYSAYMKCAEFLFNDDAIDFAHVSIRDAKISERHQQILDHRNHIKSINKQLSFFFSDTELIEFLTKVNIEFLELSKQRIEYETTSITKTRQVIKETYDKFPAIQDNINNYGGNEIMTTVALIMENAEAKQYYIHELLGSRNTSEWIMRANALLTEIDELNTRFKKYVNVEV